MLYPHVLSLLVSFNCIAKIKPNLPEGKISVTSCYSQMSFVICKKILINISENKHKILNILRFWKKHVAVISCHTQYYIFQLVLAL